MWISHLMGEKEMTLNKKFSNLHLLQRNEKHRHLTLCTLTSLFSVHGIITCNIDGNIITHRWSQNYVGFNFCHNHLGDTDSLSTCLNLVQQCD